MHAEFEEVRHTRKPLHGHDAELVTARRFERRAGTKPIAAEVGRSAGTAGDMALPGASRIQRTVAREVIRRVITVAGKPIAADDEAAIASAEGRVVGQLTTWSDSTSNADPALKKRVKKIKTDKKLLAEVHAEIVRLFSAVYNTRTYVDADDLGRQAEQDILLWLMNLSEFQGTPQQLDQYKQPLKGSAKLGAGTGKKGFRIYRTLPVAVWDLSEGGKELGVLLAKGHGGALGQALHYFQKSKDYHATKGADPTKLDDVLVEFRFDEKSEQDIVDHKRIQKGGEGAGTEGGKMGGKSEDNDLFRTGDIFSIDLKANKDLIIKQKPVVTAVAYARPR